MKVRRPNRQGYYSDNEEKIRKNHEDLVKRIKDNPLILNESGILHLEREKIVLPIVEEPPLMVYRPDLGIRYRESSGRNILLFVDVKNSIGVSMNEWDGRVKAVFDKGYIKNAKRRFNISGNQACCDFIAVVWDLTRFEVYHPRWFKIPNAEYYRKK